MSQEEQLRRGSFAVAMPIVEEASRGLRRYAVFSFAEDPEAGKQSRGRSHVARNFPASPFTAAAEVCCME
jgi:hypothetical protein